MKLIRISDVIVGPERQRKEFTPRAIETLADSIKRLCLVHAILLENDGLTLRAGERRLRAITTLTEPYVYDNQTVPPGFVPFTTTAELSESELFELELEENVQREDITWQERALAYSRLYELQQKLNATPLSISEFGRVLHPEDPKNAMQIARRHLQVADHLDNPEVAGAKTLKEAANIIRRQNESILRTELLQRVGQQESRHTLVNASAFDFVRTLPDNSVDIIITDPPYGIDMDQMNTQSGSSSGHTHTYSDGIGYANSCVRLLASEGARVSKATSVCYMFCDIRLWAVWRDIFIDEGWYGWPQPIIWDKSPTGSLLGAANGPRHVYECILMAIRGNKQVNTVGEDVIAIPGPQANKRHPAEKPVALYEKLLSWSAAPGDTILDLFCGCGPVIPAAEANGCTAIACEKDPEHYSVAALRLQNLGKEML